MIGVCSDGSEAPVKVKIQMNAFRSDGCRENDVAKTPAWGWPTDLLVRNETSCRSQELDKKYSRISTTVALSLESVWVQERKMREGKSF